MGADSALLGHNGHGDLHVLRERLGRESGGRHRGLGRELHHGAAPGRDRGDALRLDWEHQQPSHVVDGHCHLGVAVRERDRIPEGVVGGVEVDGRKGNLLLHHRVPVDAELLAKGPSLIREVMKEVSRAGQREGAPERRRRRARGQERGDRQGRASP